MTESYVRCHKLRDKVGGLHCRVPATQGFKKPDVSASKKASEAFLDLRAPIGARRCPTETRETIRAVNQTA